MKNLYSRYKTGAYVAASKGGAIALKTRKSVNTVEIPFPDGTRVSSESFSTLVSSGSVVASVIKNTVDHLDVTNGATISARRNVIKISIYKPICRGCSTSK